MSFSLINVCLVGAESTGKTTLTQALAKRYQTVWIPEYGRIYAEGKVFLPTYSEWKTHEFTEIAEGQIRLAKQLKPQAKDFLFLDTDALATSIWHKRYMNSASVEVEKLAKANLADLYLVTTPDVPFVQDGTRDGERIREWMHQEFVSTLTKLNKPFEVISGSYSERESQAIHLLENWQRKSKVGNYD